MIFEIDIPKVGMDSKGIPLEKMFFFTGESGETGESAMKKEIPWRALKAGKYYAIVANSPPIGIIESDEPFPGCSKRITEEDAGYRIGPVPMGTGTIAVFYPYPV